MEFCDYNKLCVTDAGRASISIPTPILLFLLHLHLHLPPFSSRHSPLDKNKTKWQFPRRIVWFNYGRNRAICQLTAPRDALTKPGIINRWAALCHRNAIEMTVLTFEPLDDCSRSTSAIQTNDRAALATETFNGTSQISHVWKGRSAGRRKRYNPTQLLNQSKSIRGWQSREGGRWFISRERICEYLSRSMKSIQRLTSEGKIKSDWC